MQKDKSTLPTDPKRLQEWLELQSVKERWSPIEREWRLKFPLTSSLVLLKKMSE